MLKDMQAPALRNMQVTAFLELLASDAPAPGGGSVAALNGSLGAALLAMVCRLSLQRGELAEHHEHFEGLCDEASVLQDKLTRLIDRDAEAFNGVMAAFKLPKGSEGEKLVRSAAIQEGYKAAISVPLETATLCLAVAELGADLSNAFNANAASDLGVAMDCAEAGFRGALMNVGINLSSVKDEEYVDCVRKDRACMEKKMEAARELAAKRLDGYF